MWAWYPNFEPVVDLFNKNHDDVQICWTNAGAGNDEYTKFSTATRPAPAHPTSSCSRARSSRATSPQDAIVEPQQARRRQGQGELLRGRLEPTSVQRRRRLRDPGRRRSRRHALPQGHPRQVRHHRSDDLGRVRRRRRQKLKEASGGTTLLTDFPGNGRAYQTGAVRPGRRRTRSPSAASRHLGRPERRRASKKVLTYWNDLVQKKLVGTEDASTTDYNTHLVDGTYASAIAAAWLPGYLQGLHRRRQDAVWRAAPVPQWDAADPVQINIGGSAFAVSKPGKGQESGGEGREGDLRHRGGVEARHREGGALPAVEADPRVATTSRESPVPVLRRPADQQGCLPHRGDGLQGLPVQPVPEPRVRQAHRGDQRDEQGQVKLADAALDDLSERGRELRQAARATRSHSDRMRWPGRRSGRTGHRSASPSTLRKDSP